jgi:integrase
VDKKQEILADSYSMFVYAIKSPLTRKKYEGRLAKFFDFTDIIGKTLETRCTVFEQRCKADPNWAPSGIMKFLQSLKQRVESKEISGATVRNYVKAIKLFCEMNEILVPWKKIMRGLPRSRSYANDRAPTIEEIKKITNYPDRRVKPIVYFMASSGIRLGAWDYLKWGHIMPIERNNKIIAAKVRVYAGDEDEYITFISPEAYSEIERWIDYRIECGEIVTDESWVMRNLWEVISPNYPAELAQRTCYDSSKIALHWYKEIDGTIPMGSGYQKEIRKWEKAP